LYLHYPRHCAIDKATGAQEKQQECSAECCRKFAPAQSLCQRSYPEANAEGQEKDTWHNPVLGAPEAQNCDPCAYI
jgi:hypothetical protein